MATSFAIVLGIDVKHVLDEIGHDGSLIVNPELAEPNNRRGHHVQECIEACLTRGFAVTPVELFPRLGWAGRFPSMGMPYTWDVHFGGNAEGNWRRFLRHIETSRGVITGQGRSCGHAVAYEHGRVYDPDGGEYDYSRVACEARGFFTQCLWRLDPLA